MADAKKKAEPKDSNETDLKAEREAQRANVTGGHTGVSRLVGGPTQDDLNPAYAPPAEDDDSA